MSEYNTHPMPLQPQSTPERDHVVEKLRELEDAVALLPFTASTQQLAIDREISLRYIRSAMSDILAELTWWRMR